MAKIENTELEYTDLDCDILDYYLGGKSETKEQWAQRVWECCELKSKGRDISKVFNPSKGQSWKDRAKELWGNKKTERKEAILKELKIKVTELENLKAIEGYKIREE